MTIEVVGTSLAACTELRRPSVPVDPARYCVERQGFVRETLWREFGDGADSGFQNGP